MQMVKKSYENIRTCILIRHMYLIEELKIKPFAQMKVITFMSLYGINEQRSLSYIQMLT